MTPALPVRSLVALLLLVGAVGGGWQWWLGREEADQGQALAARAKPGDIRLVSSLTCVYCAQARRWLQAQQVPFEECFIEQDAACRATFDALQGVGTPLVLVRGQAQTGFDPARMLRALPAG